MDSMNRYWQDYWEKEFKIAYGMLLDMLYKVKGYSYSEETGSGGDDDGMQLRLIEIKADIKKDKKRGKLQNNYRHYATSIYEVIRVN